MKIFILGSGGQLGRCLLDKFSKENYKVFSYSRSQVDIEETRILKDLLSKHKPELLINAAAYTKVDNAESEFEKADSVNNIAVSKIAKICKEMNIKLLHFSTDYVFDGEKDTPYLEDDKTNPKTNYGITKLAGEKSIILSGCSFIIIRTAWVFSEYGSNFLRTMLKISQTKDEVSVVNDQNGCPTYAQDIAEATLEIIKQNKSCPEKGIYHFSGDSSCTWFEFACEIFRQLDAAGLKTPKHLKPISSLEFITKAVRPKYSVLSTKKINSDFGINPSNWKEGIKKVIQKEYHMPSTENLIQQ